MPIRTKLICLGGPIHGKHVELDPLANDFRCEVLEKTGSLTWIELNSATSLAEATRHTYVRRLIYHNIYVLVHSDMTLPDALLKVFGYDE